MVGGAREPHGENVAAAARDAADAVQVLGARGEADEAAGAGLDNAVRVVVDEGQLAALEVGAPRAQIEERRVVVGGDVGLVDVRVPVGVARVHVPFVDGRVGNKSGQERTTEIERCQIVVPHDLKSGLVQQKLEEQCSFDSEAILALLMTRRQTCGPTTVEQILHCAFCRDDQVTTVFR